MVFRPVVWVLVMLTFAITSIEPAFSQIPDNALDDVLEPFKLMLPQARVVKNWAQTLFYSLILIEFVYSCSQLIFGGGDLGAFGKYMASRLFIMMIAVLLFNSGDLVAALIRATVGQVATNLGGVEPNPTDIIETGINLSSDLAGTVSWWNASKAIPILIAGIILSLVFGMIAANMLVVLAELYLLTTIGAFLLGFMGSSVTRDYAIGFFRYTMAVSIKLCVMQLIVGLGLVIMNGWLAGVQGDDITGSGLFTIVSTTLVFATLTRTLPDAARDLVNGTSSGSFGGVGSSMSYAASQMSNTANVMKQAAGSMANSVNSVSNAAMAVKAGASVAKSQGATGAAVVSGAAANVAKAAGQEIGKAVRGVNGPMARRQSMAQRVNRNLTKQANK